MPPKKAAKPASAPKQSGDVASTKGTSTKDSKPPTKKPVVDPDADKPTAYATKISRAVKPSASEADPVSKAAPRKAAAAKVTKDDTQPKPRGAKKAAPKSEPKVIEDDGSGELEEVKHNNTVIIDKLMKTAKSLSKNSAVTDNKKTSKEVQSILDALEELKMCNESIKKKVAKSRALKTAATKLAAKDNLKETSKEDPKETAKEAKGAAKGTVTEVPKEAVKPVPKSKMEKSPRLEVESLRTREKSPALESNSAVEKKVPVEKVMPIISQESKSEDSEDDYTSESWSSGEESEDLSIEVELVRD